MAKYFKLMLLLVSLVCVSCVPVMPENEKDSEVYAAPEVDDIDLSQDGDKETDSDSEDMENEFLDAVSENDQTAVAAGKPDLAKMYAKRNEITKFVLFMKILDDGIKLKRGVDQISYGINLKQLGYKEILNKDTFKSGFEKSIAGDKLVLSGMRQSGKALFSLGMDSAFAAAFEKLSSRRLEAARSIN